MQGPQVPLGRDGVAVMGPPITQLQKAEERAGPGECVMSPELWALVAAQGWLAFPDPNPDPDPNPNPKPSLNPIPNSNPDPKPTLNPNPNPDPKPDPNPDPNPDPKPDPKPDPNPDPKPDPNPDPKPDPGVEAKLDSEGFAFLSRVRSPQSDAMERPPTRRELALLAPALRRPGTP